MAAARPSAKLAAMSDPELLERYRRAAPSRIFRTGGIQSLTFEVRGDATPAWRDVYHRLLIMPWRSFVGVCAAVYVGLNLLFAALYWPDTAGLAGARPHSFVDALNFSIETLGTIGYGAMSPRDGWCNALVGAEAFTSIFLTAVLTGLTFARVSRPTARVLFSDKAVIVDFEGRPTLMVRAANQRANQMLEAEATLNLARQLITDEGVAMRVFDPMVLRRARSPLFAISWTIMHVIDEESPLHGRDESWLREINAEFLVTVAGLDEASGQRVHARTSYVADEIAWGRHFADIITPPADGDGRWTIDYTRFHDLRPLAAEPRRPPGATA